MKSLRRQWGAAVRNLRVARKLTQVQLAQAAKVDQSAISAIEHGAWSPSDGVRMKLAAALGVTVAELFPYPDSQDNKGEDDASRSGAATADDDSAGSGDDVGDLNDVRVHDGPSGDAPVSS